MSGPVIIGPIKKRRIRATYFDLNIFPPRKQNLNELCSGERDLDTHPRIDFNDDDDVVEFRSLRALRKYGMGH